MMIKILGSFKIVPDLDIVSEQEWEHIEQHTDFDYIKRDWNCFDESSLELMLRFSGQAESLGTSTELTVLTIDGAIADAYLHTLQALGVEHAVRVSDEKDLAFYADYRAHIIAAYVKHIGKQDMVMMGVQSSDEMNGKTPLLVAEYLHWPCITQVTNMIFSNEQEVIVEHDVDGGNVVRKVPLPCVLSIGNACCSHLRVPTLKDRVQARKTPIDRHEAETLLQMDAEQPKLTATKPESLAPVDETRKGTVIQGDTSAEKVEKLYQSYLKGRLK